MQDKTIVITGASDGIGAEAARQLHKLGARVIIVGRSKTKTEAIAAELSCEYYIADFAKLRDVRVLANKLHSTLPVIDILVNNAGGIFGKRELTEDGCEKTMQVNHLAHFMLTNLLMDTLVKSKATIINTSSIASKLFSKLDITDINMEHGYSPNAAYGNAKLENILFTKELNRRYAAQGISAVAFHPGNVSTSFAKGSSSVLRLVYRTPLKYIIGLISVEKGADTLVWLATSMPGKDWQTGQYYYKRNVTKTIPQSYDEQTAASLWTQSAEVIANHVS